MKASRWLRERERRMAALLAKPAIHIIVPGASSGKKAARIDLRAAGTIDLHYDRSRDAFYFQLPEPFADVRLYERMQPTLIEWARIRAGLVSFGAFSGE